MKVYAGREIRNVAVTGHGNSGKTSLVAGCLFTTGATTRLTRVDEGNTLTDFDDEEIQRKITISTAVAIAEWKKHKINLLDTPGFNIFINDTKASMVAADAALVLVEGVAGVEVQTEKVWGFAEEFKLPRVLVVNKLDRELSSFSRALESIHEAFGRAAVPVQLPLGAERDFRGVIDLITMKAYSYQPDGDGKGQAGDIPAEFTDASREAHEALVEMVAEGRDDLMEEFFESGTLSPERMIEGLRDAVAEHRLFPVLCASGLRNIGTDRVLDFMVDNLPPPTAMGPKKGQSNDAEVERAVGDAEPASVFVFKTVADPFAGRLSYFKVFSGVVKNDANLLNSRSAAVERLSHIGCLNGKEIVPVTELRAGDIGAVAKLKDTLSGDTLYEKGSPIEYPQVKLPEPSIAFAVRAKTRQDEDRMGASIQRMLEEDQSLRFYRDPQTKEFLLAGSGQQQVEVAVSKLNKRYGVSVELHAPKIPYRETIRGNADVHGRHKKQTGGHGQFGDCRIRMAPLPRGEQFEFVNEIFGGAIPKQYIPAVEKGIVEAAEKGYLAGYPVVDFRVVLYDGSYHDVDSNELSFKLAGRKAFRLAMEQAKPALLEPIMNVEVHAPVEYAGDLMGDMNGRRGRISGMDVKGNTQIIRAQVPMAEMLNYQNDLTSMTQGRASFSMEMSHYDFVPQQLGDKIVAEAKAAREGVAEEEE
ncbi:MAG: elongation factor G [Bryobacteraceae bacterium]|nr:elongation factor G [Bryobacteraceae bacterium]